MPSHGTRYDGTGKVKENYAKKVADAGYRESDGTLYKASGLSASEEKISRGKIC